MGSVVAVGQASVCVSAGDEGEEEGKPGPCWDVEEEEDVVAAAGADDDAGRR